MGSVEVQAFIDRWKASGGAERANYQLFLSELCDVLKVSHPDPTVPDEDENAYVFEKSVVFNHGDGTSSPGRIDLYKRGCFVLETKQGVEAKEKEFALSNAHRKRQNRRKKGTATRGTGTWDTAMIIARGQAEGYARALPHVDGRPPFLVVVDVGHSFELYSEFSQSGGYYIPFPDPQSHRFLINRLMEEGIRERLRTVWVDPLSLDPSRHSAKVTRDIADRLAALAKSLEASENPPEAVASFLMRCLFTMFAEDIGLLPAEGFTNLLKSLRGSHKLLAPMLEELWGKMKTGGVSTALREKVLRFNGGLFEDTSALSLNDDQFELLVEASVADWRDVEPAIFGTLLERALDPIERHNLGAHFTPRAYVERLVVPTIVEPIREEWNAVRTAAFTLANQGKVKEATDEVEDFHRRLCEVRVLDPACGSGNFLYVTLEHLKRIEGEAIGTLLDLYGEKEMQDSFHLHGLTVDPHQLLGLEINPRAAAITELVLWIGYLQWHTRTRGKVPPPEPIIKNFKNIECRDALLEWDAEEPVLDEEGNPVTRWDGRTKKPSPVTGELIPDETARVPVVRYLNPRKAEWPVVDYVVGNPPFIGDKEMRESIGDSYVDALRQTFKGTIPESTDYVLYWWKLAAEATAENTINRFGFIATNSLRQKFNRRVLDAHLDSDKPVSIVFAIPDHPWVDSADGAAVRISMTVVEAGHKSGIVENITDEKAGGNGIRQIDFSRNKGRIHADLSVGPNVSKTVPLKYTKGLHSNGVMISGSGFIVTQGESDLLGINKISNLERHIRPYRNGRDLTQIPRRVNVIDFYGLDLNQVRNQFPEAYQWVLERVKPVRDQNRRKSTREKWWTFAEPRKGLRAALAGLNRYIATPETAKHRFFVFLDASILPDHMLIAIALEDAYFLGILSSRIHVVWALASGGRLGVGNDPRYNKSRCLDTFVFPDTSNGSEKGVRELAETLDAHRKRQQAQFPKLTMTAMYNVLEKLRAGEALSKKDQEVHEKGLVSLLKQIHDDLDAAVFEAYGWPSDLSDEEILERLVALNAERAAEEKRGLIRWLRPEFQNPEGKKEAEQSGLYEETGAEPKKAGKAAKVPWPKTMADQAQAVRAALESLGRPASSEEVARIFSRGRVDRVSELLETLTSLGQIKQMDDGRFVSHLK